MTLFLETVSYTKIDCVMHTYGKRLFYGYC